MPVMQMNDVRSVLCGPRRAGSAEQRELVCVGRKWTRTVLAEVDQAFAIRCEQRMIEDEILDALVAARHAPGVQRFIEATVYDLDGAELFRAIDLVQGAVGWRRHGRPPAEIGKRDGKVAHDITDAADLAAGQCAVFGCEKEYGARVDRVLPNVCDAVAGREYPASPA
mgnify:CR=1 FL=1